MKRYKDYCRKVVFRLSNYERIRDMTEEEMTAFLYAVRGGLIDEVISYENTLRTWENWLQEPTNETNGIDYERIV